MSDRSINLYMGNDDEFERRNAALKELALSLGYKTRRGGKGMQGCLSELFQAIADGEVVLFKLPVKK